MASTNPEPRSLRRSGSTKASPRIRHVRGRDSRLGAEPYDLEEMAEKAEAAGKQVELVALERIGGMRQAIEQGVLADQRFPAERDSVKQQPVPLSIIPAECGGSDACSGVSGNPRSA